ncbi:hypothetical protein O9X98_06695 [Agrobacterium salinitolerans]|nr:hypothetical protein [Agrobacterium salinitolerans]
MRAFDGRLYRSLRTSTEDLARYTTSYAFDTKGEILGCLATEAMRDYFEVEFDSGMATIPRNLAMSKGRLLISDGDAKKTLHWGREFVVEEDDLDRAEELEEMARKRFSKFLVIDGTVWAQATELMYRASPPKGTTPGKVLVATGGCHYSPDDPGYPERYPAWSDPDSRFFSALSPEAAAEYARIPLNTVPLIDVVDSACVGADFEALDLERCARNVVHELEDTISGLRPSRFSEVRNVIVGFLRSDRPLGRSPDKLADLLAQLALEARRTKVAEKAMKRFTPDSIDAFVERYTNRPIEIAAIESAAFKY